jgi:hypothetical protein
MSSPFTAVHSFANGRGMRVFERTKPERLEFMRTLTTQGDIVRTQLLSIPTCS